MKATTRNDIDYMLATMSYDISKLISRAVTIQLDNIAVNARLKTENRRLKRQLSESQAEIRKLKRELNPQPNWPYYSMNW